MSNTTIELSRADEAAAEQGYCAELVKALKAGVTVASSELIARGGVIELSPRQVQAELSALHRRVNEAKEVAKLPSVANLAADARRADAAVAVAEKKLEDAIAPLRAAVAAAKSAAEQAHANTVLVEHRIRALRTLVTLRGESVLKACGVSLPSTVE
jgi:hypothetical protein